MALDSRERISAGQAVEEAMYGQEEWKSMRGNRKIRQASEKFGDVVQEVIRKGKRHKGQYSVDDKEMKRILHQVTGSSDGYIQFKK